MNITKNNVAVFAKDETLSSYEFWKVLNGLRKERGASHVKHNHFIAKLKDELGGLPRGKSFTPSRQSEPVEVYQLTERQMLRMGMRDSKVIREQVMDWIDLLVKKVNELEAEKAARAEASLSFKEQSAALKLSRELDGKDTLSHHYSNEADLLNRVILGCTAKAYRAAHDLNRSDSLRNTLTTVELEAFTSLRKANETYLLDGLSYTERKNKLVARYKRYFNQQLIDELHLLN